MLSCVIQLLEKTKDGWHIRFSGSNDDFWHMLAKFKAEQKESGRLSCFYNPRLFGKGGWFCSEAVLVKYANDFANYTEIRRKAEREYNLKHEYTQQTWWNDKEEQQQKQRDRQRQWEDTQRRQEQEQRDYKPSVRIDTSLNISQALSLLELPSPAAKLTEKQVKLAFHKLALKAHPDTGGSHEAMVQLNKAYQLVLLYCQKVPVR